MPKNIYRPAAAIALAATALVTVGIRKPSERNQPTSDQLADAAFIMPDLKPTYGPLVDLGRELFFHPAIECSQCHQPARSFFSFIRQPVGPHSGDAHGTLRPGSRLDVQNVTTPTSLNAAYHPDNLQLHDGRAGRQPAPIPGQDLTGGPLNVAIANDIAQDLRARRLLQPHEMGFFVQACVALQGHNLIDANLRNDLDKQFRSRFAAIGISPSTFGSNLKYLDIEAYALALAVYQGTITARYAPIQRHLRGEKVYLSAPIGWHIFRRACAECHSSPGGSGQFYDLGTSDILGNRFTKPVRASQLYNLLDKPAYGHGGHWQTIPEAIRGHGPNITPLDPVEIQTLEAHLLEDWFDPTVPDM